MMEPGVDQHASQSITARMKSDEHYMSCPICRNSASTSYSLLPAPLIWDLVNHTYHMFVICISIWKMV